MRAIWRRSLLAVWLTMQLVSSSVYAEQIETVDGESISATGLTITNRQIAIPAIGEMPVRNISLEDLVDYNQTLIREMGELKTRYVRVEHLSTTKAILSLAEVLVFEGDKNVALEGTATQIGTDYNGPPERAIDGNTNGDLEGGHSVTHTNYVPLPWWEVDLKRDVKVRQIEIWNRTDSNVSDRLNGSRVVLLDANRKPLWVHYLDKPPKRKVCKIPAKGSEFTPDDLKQFQRYSGVTVTAAQAMTAEESELELVGGGKFYGKMTAWTADSITVEVRFGDQTRTLTVPTAMLREIWPQDVVTGKLAVPREGEQSAFDNVFAKSDSGEIQRVAGKIKGRDGESLLFEIDGQTRKLNWGKFVGVVFELLPPAADEPQYEIVKFSSGQQISGRCLNLTADTFQMETRWKQSLELPRAQLSSFTARNGKLVSLTDRTPGHVEQVGYLDLVRPYQVNKSFSGDALQIGDVTYREGLCTHSRTVLDYDISRGFSRFRCEIGLQKGDGDQGDVIVRVRVNGQVKFEEAVTGGQPAQTVNVDLTGGKSLQLEVDYGEGFDVADHLVWGTPVLLKGK